MKFLKKLITDNPVFVLVLGMCSALAVTSNFEQAYIMGICLTFVLLLSNLIICIIKKLVPDNVKIPVYILIIGTFVTIIELLMQKFLPNLYNTFGVYLSLIVVNCIVLGKALQVASKENIKTTSVDSLQTGLGYTLALMMIAFVREILGSGTLTLFDSLSDLFNTPQLIIKISQLKFFPLVIFSNPAGAFITLGLIAALFNYIKEDKHERN